MPAVNSDDPNAEQYLRHFADLYGYRGTNPAVFYLSA